MVSGYYFGLYAFKDTLMSESGTGMKPLVVATMRVLPDLDGTPLDIVAVMVSVLPVSLISTCCLLYLFSLQWIGLRLLVSPSLPCYQELTP